MAGLSIMILVVSSLATGSTRHEVYRTSSGRTYGRIGKHNDFNTIRFNEIYFDIYICLSNIFYLMHMAAY